MLDKVCFFQHYPVESAFKKSQLEWKQLEEIYDDFVSRKEELEKCCAELEQFLLEQFSSDEFKASYDSGEVAFHSIRGRVKSPEHLIEKIIRKRGKEHSRKYYDINVSNYRSIIHDLIGIRILVLAKEGWEEIFNRITKLFPADEHADIRMEETPIAYTRYGDRDIYNHIKLAHSNKGYRSQHYVVCFHGVFCEIQVRTLSEEVFGEFDHKVKYPYREHNKFLLRYTNTLSQLLDSVDELISTCFQMQESGWDKVDQYFEGDRYTDWEKINISQTPQHKDKDAAPELCYEDDRIQLQSSIRNIFCRKG